jgi:hypothetical protein
LAHWTCNEPALSGGHLGIGNLNNIPVARRVEIAKDDERYRLARRPYRWPAVAPVRNAYRSPPQRVWQANRGRPLRARDAPPSVLPAAEMGQFPNLPGAYRIPDVGFLLMKLSVAGKMDAGRLPSSTLTLTWTYSAVLSNTSISTWYFFESCSTS